MDSPRKLILEKLKSLGYEGGFDVLIPPAQFGDYSTNAAFVLKKNPEEMREEVEKDERLNKIFSRIEVAQNGFLNFFLSDSFLKEALVEIIKAGPTYGNSDFGKGEKINLEYVSANPTGPLTIGNARGGPFGDILGNILKKTGYEVHKEYYVNDSGRQIGLLGESVARRYLQLGGRGIEFPEDNYQGEYVTDLAREMRDKRLFHGDESNFDELAQVCREFALEKVVGWVKEALVKIGVKFDTWFYESSLHKSGKVKDVLDALRFGDMTYEKDDALWLKIDGENDAVLIKNTGDPTYLLGDIAYSRDKFNRGFDRMINILGADHHSDAQRLKHALTQGLGYDPKKIEIVIYQFVTLKGVGKASKRRGQFVTLDDLTNEVGKDVVRFFFATKSMDTHMEFDLELAKEESNKNPVFYVQYANARINSLFKKMEESNLKIGTDFSFLKEKEELSLIKCMLRLPDLIEDMARRREIHHLTTYVWELANLFHSFYEKHRIAGAPKETAEARLGLVYGVQNVLKVVLDLLGVSIPERM